MHACGAHAAYLDGGVDVGVEEQDVLRAVQVQPRRLLFCWFG